MFASQQFPGVKMNRYGVAILGGRVQDADTRGAVIREAIAVGWHLVPSAEPDVGRVWVNPSSVTKTELPPL